MSKVKKYFGEINMTWGRVLLFSVITAAYTALINQVPFLYETSFQDIAINLECWILFAVFIIVNCKKWWEASLKCFVFFLVGQPLIYLIEVPFLGWDVFGYYKYWFIITLLTLPGAAVAYQLKRKDWLSVAVLSVANAYLAYACVDYFTSTLTGFPKHLLSAVFCFALALFFVLVFFDRRDHRMVCIAVIVAVIFGTSIYFGRNFSSTVSLGEGEWSYHAENDTICSMKLNENNEAKLTAKHNGTTFVTFENEDGEKKEFAVTVSGGGIFVQLMEDE